MKGDMSEKDKYCMFSLICGILKTRQINAYNKTETYSDTENKLCLPVVRAVRGEPACPDGPAAHVFLEGWSQVWMSLDLSDGKVRAGLRSTVEEL